MRGTAMRLTQADLEKAVHLWLKDCVHYLADVKVESVQVSRSKTYPVRLVACLKQK